MRSASSRRPIRRRRRTPRYRACAAFTRSPCCSSVTRAAASVFAGQPRSRETSAISASATTQRARATASFGPKARAALRSSAFARSRSPSCAIAMPRSASAGASSRSATRFNAPRGSPAASARAAALISESIGIPSHLSLPTFDARRLGYLTTNNHEVIEKRAMKDTRRRQERAMTKHVTGTFMTASDNSVRRIRHHAYACWDSEETRHFYEDILGMPLIATIVLEDPVRTDGSMYCHTFFEIADGSVLAFYEHTSRFHPKDFAARSGFRSNVALEVESEAMVRQFKRKLDAA